MVSFSEVKSIKLKKKFLSNVIVQRFIMLLTVHAAMHVPRKNLFTAEKEGI